MTLTVMEGSQNKCFDLLSITINQYGRTEYLCRDRESGKACVIKRRWLHFTQRQWKIQYD